MNDSKWHHSHIEDQPTLAEVNARWCTRCNRMIRTDQGEATPIGTSPCAGTETEAP